MSNPEAEPEFGPNGAVMNAPTMTPELKADYKREASAKHSLLRGLPVPLILLVVLVVQLTLQPPLATAILGYLPVLPVVIIALRIFHRGDKRD